MVLYAIAFLLAVAFVLGIFVIRMLSRRRQNAKIARAKAQNPTLPIHDPGPRPTLGGVAREVGDRMFPPERPFRPPFRYENYPGDGIGVHRVQESFDTELPSYGANTLPVRPQPTYDPARHAPELFTGSTATLPVYTGDLPPKYN